jgi:hypothetical protein
MKPKCVDCKQEVGQTEHDTHIADRLYCTDCFNDFYINNACQYL